MIHLFFRSYLTFTLSLFQKVCDLLQNICCIHHVFDSCSLFFPFFCPRAIRSRPSLFAPVFFFKVLYDGIGSDSLLEKSECLFRSFTHKKRAIRRKNQRAIIHNPAFLCHYKKVIRRAKAQCLFLTDPFRPKCH